MSLPKLSGRNSSGWFKDFQVLLWPSEIFHAPVVFSWDSLWALPQVSGIILGYKEGFVVPGSSLPYIKMNW